GCTRLHFHRRSSGRDRVRHDCRRRSVCLGRCFWSPARNAATYRPRSFKRRGKCPAEIDFANEIALAKRFGWLRELAEDVEFTQKCQEKYKTDVRYGQSFVRTASTSAMKAERERFIGAFVEAHGARRHSRSI